MHRGRGRFNLLCWHGIHNWSAWVAIRLRVKAGGRQLTQQRYCLTPGCGRIEQRPHRAEP